MRASPSAVLFVEHVDECDSEAGGVPKAWLSTWVAKRCVQLHGCNDKRRGVDRGAERDMSAANITMITLRDFLYNVNVRS